AMTTGPSACGIASVCPTFPSNPAAFNFARSTPISLGTGPFSPTGIPNAVVRDGMVFVTSITTPRDAVMDGVRFISVLVVNVRASVFQLELDPQIYGRRNGDVYWE